MELGLNGKAALVSGGSHGTGRAVAEALAREGAAMTLYARTETDVRGAADEIAAATGAEALGVAADVTSADDCARAIDAAVAGFGGLDVLVTNMGGPPFRASLPWEEDDWRDAWELDARLLTR